VRSIIGIQGDARRFRVDGGDVVLGPKAALALTLILHELATNAVKYGALSNAAGRVSLSWRVDEIEGVRQFRLRWQESGGPPVTAPSRSGFGSRLIARSFPGAREGTASVYLPDGLLFTLDAAFDALAGGREESFNPGGAAP
jgi:two-component sensor histidine kinase